MSTGKGGRGGARGGTKASPVKAKATTTTGKRSAPAEVPYSDLENSVDEHHVAQQEAILRHVLDEMGTGCKAGGVEAEEDSMESDDDLPELAPAPPRDGVPRDMPCDCGDSTCTKRIYFKEKWPFPRDMLERMYSLECTAMLGRLVHIHALSIDDAKEALEIMDSKDEASRSECWRHTWRVDVLTGDMEVPLCLMDSQLKPTLQTLVSDFYREVHSVLMNEVMRDKRGLVQKMYRNPNPTVAGPTYPYPWSLRYLYQHLSDRELGNDATDVAFYKAIERLEYRYEWEAIGGPRPATLQLQKQLLTAQMRKKEAASPSKAARAKGASSPPKKPQAQATASQKPAAAGGGAARPSTAAKPKANTTGRPMVYDLDADGDDSEDEPPELVPFNPPARNPLQSTGGGGGGQTGGATRAVPMPPQPPTPQQSKPAQPKPAQQMAPQPKAPQPKPVQAAGPSLVQSAQTFRPPSAGPVKGVVPNGGMRRAGGGMPPSPAQTAEPPRSQAVQPPAPPSSAREPMEFEREVPVPARPVSTSFQTRAEGEMRLNMPADLRAKAEAELLAMLAAEEEEKAKAAGATATKKKKKKTKRGTRGRKRSGGSSASALSTSGQGSATEAASTGGAAPSSGEDSDEESDAEEAPINQSPEPEPEPEPVAPIEPEVPRPPLEPLRQLSLPGLPPTLPKELQDLDNSGTDARELEEGRDGEMVEVPDEFLCPVSLVRMVDPVVAADGNTYERESIERWILRASQQGVPLTSPLTNEQMGMALIPNNNLRKLILAYCEKNGVPYFQ